MKLTCERLKEVLSYDPSTGVFRYAIATNRRMARRVGEVAGCLRPDGYLAIGIDGVNYLAHRLAWMWMTGNFPDDQIDHKNGVSTDNSAANLRSVTSGENRQNVHRTKRGIALLGASWCARERKWRASIKTNGALQSLGYFDTSESAHARYMQEKRVQHPFSEIAKELGNAA